MDHIKMNKIVLAVLAIIVFSSAVACHPVDGKPSSNNSLVDELVGKEGFAFRKNVWFSTKSDVLDRNGLHEDDLEEFRDGQALRTKDHITFDNPSFKAQAVYVFDEGKLVSGDFVALFEDEASLLACAKDLKAVLDKSLELPLGGTTDVLTQVPSPGGSGAGPTWYAKDKSQLSIRTFDHTKTQSESPYYIIYISVSAPAPERTSQP